MNARKCLAALTLLLPIAASAQAKSFAWCQVSGGKYETYLSDIVEIGDGPDAFVAFKAGAFGNGFRQYVQSSFDPHASGLDCNKQDSRFFAEDYIDVLISGNPGYRFVRTGWRGARISAADHRNSDARDETRDGALHYRR
jgi:hypothetical protein